MNLSRRFIIFILFLCLEAVLIVYVDQPVSECLRRIDPKITDFFRAWTDLGKSKWYLWPSGLGVVLCAIAVRQKSLRKNLRERYSKAGEFLLSLFLAIAISGILTDILKPLIGRARPVELEQDGLYEFHPLSFTARWNSMPSGHATTAVALALILASSYPRLRIPAFAYASTLALSRVMVNAHYVSDVLAGVAVAFLTVQALLRLRNHNGICHINHRIFPIDERISKR